MRRSSRVDNNARRLFVAALLAAAGWLAQAGCTERTERGHALLRASPDSSAYVASLGNLRTGAAPSRAQLELATFLFGVEPDPALGLIKPMRLAVSKGELWVCDGALQAVLRWTPSAGALEAAALIDPPSGPVAIAANATGDRFVGGEGGVLSRYDVQGRPMARHSLPRGSGARIGGIACVGDEVWVSDTPAHRIEVFDAASGAHRRSIGQRGRGPGEFGFPLDLAVGRDGNVYVTDMLNARVQVLDRTGRWLRDIGGPGDRIGSFGRPKAVTIGPDGTIFVVDATSQCVHAFDENGKPLLTFGGATDGADALVLPAGIAIWIGPLDATRALPANFQPAYYVLVAEQIVRPGLRVYAWSGSRVPPEPAVRKARDPAFRLAASVENPHWHGDGCRTCHPAQDGAPRQIAGADVDRLCLSCHDGKKAIDEAHPVGRLAVTGRTRVPAGWPLVDGRIGCLTCHDIRGHCDVSRSRPSVNPALVRSFDADNPLATCKQCHITQEWRVNPHRREIAGLASPAAACGFCHASTPRQEADGTWSFDAGLRAEPTGMCLNCHIMHADPAPRGHLGAAVNQTMMQIMLEGERDRGISGVFDHPRLLPLDNGRVACSTCHNPHAADALPAEVFHSLDSLARSTAPADAGKALRIEHMSLCRYCHPK